jgi:hypothetical protein
MAEIKILEDACERGPRGRRGPTGPTGPAGPVAQSRQVFTTDGTYVPTPGTTSVQVRMCGGGGAGGGSLGSVAGVSVGGGGGSGAALDFFVDDGGPITGGPVVVGPGGTGVLGATGNDGGSTSVTINAVVYTATPGSGGGIAMSNPLGPVAATVAGGNTLAGSSAVDVVSGACGTPGVATDLNLGQGGTGGGGALGIGGNGGPIFGTNGQVGRGFGSGGGGAGSTTTDQTGGDGAPGVVIIDEFA